MSCRHLLIAASLVLTLTCLPTTPAGVRVHQVPGAAASRCVSILSLRLTSRASVVFLQVYVLTEFQGRLLAGINSRVQMYK